MAENRSLVLVVILGVMIGAPGLLAFYDIPSTLVRSPVASSPLWRPEPGTTWQWQLTDLPVDLSIDAEVYDIDLFDNDGRVVAALHAHGRKVICYVSVGSWEDWRPDADQFPPSIIGKEYIGWPGEKWLDIRRIDLIGPIMQKRLDLCKEKGFDAVEPDNIDGYTYDTGFALTYQDQITYNIWLANQSHRRGLSIGLKNDAGQVADLLPHFEWALTEDCFYEGWCDRMLPFIEAGKAVFAAEYTDTGATTDQFCQLANAMNFSVILKHRGLDAYRETCRVDTIKVTTTTETQETALKKWLTTTIVTTQRLTTKIIEIESPDLAILAFAVSISGIVGFAAGVLIGRRKKASV